MADGEVTQAEAPSVASVSSVSDLRERVITAVAMVAIAGSALLLGGGVWVVFTLAVGLGVLREWNRLVKAFVSGWFGRAIWFLIGLGYIGLATFLLLSLRTIFPSLMPVITLLMIVIATDIGAYFAGRTFGGPKIAPAISPSKTWSGLAGGALCAALVLRALISTVAKGDVGHANLWAMSFQIGVPMAILAQIGDFFESWMKRRAGVKDSGGMLPGHGGLFDRLDGMLAVSFVGGVILVMALTRGAH